MEIILFLRAFERSKGTNFSGKYLNLLFCKIIEFSFQNRDLNRFFQRKRFFSDKTIFFYRRNDLFKEADFFFSKIDFFLKESFFVSSKILDGLSSKRWIILTFRNVTPFDSACTKCFITKWCNASM